MLSWWVANMLSASTRIFIDGLWVILCSKFPFSVEVLEMRKKLIESGLCSVNPWIPHSCDRAHLHASVFFYSIQIFSRGSFKARAEYSRDECSRSYSQGCRIQPTCAKSKFVMNHYHYVKTGVEMLLLDFSSKLTSWDGYVTWSVIVTWKQDLLASSTNQEKVWIFPLWPQLAIINVLPTVSEIWCLYCIKNMFLKVQTKHIYRKHAPNKLAWALRKSLLMEGFLWEKHDGRESVVRHWAKIISTPQKHMQNMISEAFR